MYTYIYICMHIHIGVIFRLHWDCRCYIEIMEKHGNYHNICWGYMFGLGTTHLAF